MPAPTYTVPTWRERFWAKVDKRGPDECWPWTAATVYGYGAFRLDGRTMRAHRIAWAEEHGDPGDLHVCHHCDNPPCVNPAHLFLGTDADNLADMRAKGRGYVLPPLPKGELHPRNCLTDEEVRRIRAALDNGEAQTVLARAHGVSQTTVWRIAHGERTA